MYSRVYLVDLSSHFDLIFTTCMLPNLDDRKSTFVSIFNLVFWCFNKICLYKGWCGGVSRNSQVYYQHAYSMLNDMDGFWIQSMDQARNRDQKLRRYFSDGHLQSRNLQSPDYHIPRSSSAWRFIHGFMVVYSLSDHDAIHSLVHWDLWSTELGDSLKNRETLEVWDNEWPSHL